MKTDLIVAIVLQDASQADIRRAYRKLSLQLHPDKNKAPDAEEKFRQVNVKLQLKLSLICQHCVIFQMKHHTTNLLFLPCDTNWPNG